MSNNDCVSRSWLLAEYDRRHEGPAGKARKLIEDAPAVLREMTAREYLRGKNRMKEYLLRVCHGLISCSRANCSNCRFSALHRVPSAEQEVSNPDEAVAIVEKWAREHPERSEE